ncbi:hypothetical protein NHP190003_00170 [Helicobacter sp. NHP19-003]|uniref:Outer membrane protein n=1 Tax=Helicobacter gastrocanis TaxID=2849641 RepID=A0ABM7SG41_9HELI|nr:outer membrane protein [Helicobacter sp. NHP19-003]BCZ16735.1 hypothetical protein NHP190003_00170 [Helicobacter sp. NHP19-003]
MSAEKNGAFVEGGFQYSNVTGENNYSQPTITQTQDGYTYTNEGFSQPGKTTGNLYGADIQVGYKQLFGKKKRFGLRYYGFFSGQGGSYVTDISAVPSQFISGNVITGKAANLFYGAGVDAIYNFCSTMNTEYSDLAKVDKVYGKTNFSPTFVQFIINIGFRTNFSAHQGFEVGVRIPTINDPYYTEKDTLANGGGKTTITFRRTVAIYANYVYNF